MQDHAKTSNDGHPSPREKDTHTVHVPADGGVAQTGGGAADDDAANAAGDGADPWYAEGLRFTCRWPECVACCTGEPGYVWVDSEEVERLAAALTLDRESFLRTYTREVSGSYSLLEKSCGDCTFLGKHGCDVYRDRPTQCSTYPFWPEVLRSRSAWEAESRHCPGIGHGERVYSREEIDALLAKRRTRHPRG